MRTITEFRKGRSQLDCDTLLLQENMAERVKELTTASARAQRKALLGEDDATMVFETSKEVTVVNTFDRMSLREELLRGIYAYG